MTQLDINPEAQTAFETLSQLYEAEDFDMLEALIDTKEVSLLIAQAVEVSFRPIPPVIQDPNTGFFAPNIEYVTGRINSLLQDQPFAVFAAGEQTLRAIREPSDALRVRFTPPPLHFEDLAVRMLITPEVEFGDDGEEVGRTHTWKNLDQPLRMHPVSPAMLAMSHAVHSIDT